MVFWKSLKIVDDQYLYPINYIANADDILPSRRSLGLQSEEGKIGSSRERSIERPYKIRGLMNGCPLDEDILYLA